MIEGRKTDHLKLCAERDVEFQNTTTLLEDVRFVHDAMAEIAFSEIDLGTSFMGRKLRAPFLISAITGGMDAAKDLNRDLAKAAQELGIGFCLGSQRPMMENPSAADSYQVRRYAPDIPILGNIGIQQAATAKPADIERLVTSIGADGIAVHLNPAQELSQAEGDRSFPDGAAFLRVLTKRMPGKVMVKETGCGISREVALRLKAAGVRTLDTAGAGGTSWTRVERLRGAPGRAALAGAGRAPLAGEEGGSWLDEWGIPTAASLLETAPLGFTLVASGGIRNGLDIAKCLALGADVCGMALPIVRAYCGGGYDGVVGLLHRTIDELKSVMVLVGAKDLSSLKQRKILITGRLLEWKTCRSATTGRSRK
ncbi:MAG: type 2 isopentenyl-diphosphate Delta-isomerase [Elusimicrobia bacterium GWA2_69_24]|nr:MAG: type 2 isopentenyl-diphosphate Delta-isomerase [Elusimicrobia bacterium GWA2_69_24]HBL17559.1 type 2 isopentenyl-diphosphate Delta-isomerase [Elusimicrobiota bacterium]